MSEQQQKRPLTQILNELERGHFVDDLTEEHEDVLAKVKHTGKQGVLTINLKYKWVNEEQITIQPEITAKPPKLPRAESLFYVTGDNDLMRNDPRQREMELRGVPSAGDQPVRGVPGSNS